MFLRVIVVIMFIGIRDVTKREKGKIYNRNSYRSTKCTIVTVTTTTKLLCCDDAVKGWSSTAESLD